RDALGRIVSVEDPRGNKVRYRYDARGDLVEVTDRLSNPPTRFTYRTDRPHYLDQVNDPLGRPVMRTEYGSDGRLGSLRDADDNPTAMTYNLSTLTQTITDPIGKTSTMVFDNRGNLISASDPTCGCSGQTPVTPMLMTYEADAVMTVTQVVG